MSTEQLPRKLRVRIEYTVEVDPDAWMESYRETGPGLGSVRDSVKRHFGGATVATDPAASECGARWVQ